MAAAYFVCHIRPNFQISFIYAFIGCPQSVDGSMFQSVNSNCFSKQTLISLISLFAHWEPVTVAVCKPATPSGSSFKYSQFIITRNNIKYSQFIITRNNINSCNIDHKLRHCHSDTIREFLCKLGMKPIIHLLEIIIFTLYHVIVRPTKTIKVPPLRLQNSGPEFLVFIIIFQC